MLIKTEPILRQRRELTKLNPTCCIYAQQVQDGRTYTGQTADAFTIRIRRHLSDLEKGKHCNKNLQAYYSEHGKGSVISFVQEICTPAELDQKEAEWIAYYKSRGKSFNVLSGVGKQEQFKQLKRSRAKQWQMLDKHDAIIMFSNYMQWCSIHSISHTLYKMLSGKQPHYAGYRNTSELGKVYTLLNSNGKPVEIKNVVTYAEANGLDASKLYQVIRCKRYDYAGYTNPANLRPTKPMRTVKIVLTPEKRAERARVAAKAYYWQHRQERIDYAKAQFQKRKSDAAFIASRKVYMQQYHARNFDTVAIDNEKAAA